MPSVLRSGLRLTVLAGATIPAPLPADLTARLRSVRVQEADGTRSLFSLTFDAGRSGPFAALDTPVLRPPLVPFARVTVVLTFAAMPRVLFDGIITNFELTPADGPGTATLTVTGEDVSYLLDRQEVDAEHPAMDDSTLVRKILGPYASYRILPQVIPPRVAEPPLPIERIPTQHGSDLAHLKELADRHGYVCYVIPGPQIGASTFYWGPPVRAGAPQPALSVDLGPETNVRTVRFRTDALTPLLVEGEVQDPRTGSQMAVDTVGSLRPPLSSRPLWAEHRGDIRRRRRVRDSGTGVIHAFEQAQSQVDASVDAVVAEGEADGGRYGDVLRPRALVGVRGAGWSHDGNWYVRRVEHELAPGSYTQRFTLTRDGHGPTVPVVRP
ncbi:hypothetical protein [Streptomyces sp. NPDC005476]|uniref:phage late control D family protein n=1 Tax=Streptomyces sp. NPDC005476 TaxID=3156882 RepID=UPI003454CF57